MNKKGLYSLLLLAGALALGGCGGTKPVESEEIPLLEPVGTNAETETVLVRDLYEAVTRDGEYTPYTEELCFEEGGTIEHVFVKLGERVQEGDLLAEMNEGRYTWAESQAASNYQNAKQNMETQIAEYQEELKKCKTAEEKEWYELLIRQARESYEAQEPELKRIWDAAKACLGRNILTAAFDGVVTAVRADGDVLSTGQAAVAISDLSRGYLAVDGYLSPEDYASYDEIYAVINGTKIALQYEPEVQKEGRSYTLLLPEKGITASYGDFAIVCLVKNMHPQVLSLPVGVVTRENGKSYVHLQDGERWVRREVTTGYSNSYYIEILSGLKEGDRVYAK